MMRAASLVTLVLSVSVYTLPRVSAQQTFDIPLRINMGGPELQDSYGRVWLGDGPGAGDPLGIRPNDLGGTNTQVNWCPADSNSLDLLGFDPLDVNVASVMSTIRWDDAADANDFEIALPVPDGDYWLNLYFQECCCDFRHFKIALEGDLVEEDVSYQTYEIVDPDFPALLRHGKLSYPVGVADGVLDIALLPCFECPGATDGNAIIDAIELISDEECDHNGLDFNCSFDSDQGGVVGTWTGLAGADSYRVLRNGAEIATLPGSAREFVDSDASGVVSYTIEALDGEAVFARCRCSTNAFKCASDLVCDSFGTEVALSWDRAGGIDVDAYEVHRDGALIATLPATADVFEDEPGARSATYTVTPLTNPPGLCGPLSCLAVLRDAPFAVPLRINMGGETTIDSLGREWLGDRPCALPADADPLGIRRDPFGGTNAICNWCVPEAASVEKVGLSSASAADRHILSTIRWDLGVDGIDFYIDLPVPDRDDYIVSLYFDECCCVDRHFQISIQDEIVAPDVSYRNYDASPALTKVGLLSFTNVVVDSGLLSIGFLPCPLCPGVLDTNAIISAVEIIPGCDNVRICPSALSCSTDGDQVTGVWNPGACLELDGWVVRRDGELIQELPADAAEFTDTMPSRVAVYSVTPVVAEGEEPCEALTCSAIATDLPFAIPVRLNMGGRTLVDSRGRTWFGDGAGTGDQLSIRRDPAGGTNTIENWCNATVQSNADSLQAFGLDPYSPSDLGIFDTIRWDTGDDDLDGSPGEFADQDGGDVDFLLDLPVPDGDYLVSLYFTECGSPFRFFQIELEDELVAESVSVGEYSRSGRFGRTGRLSFDEILVEDGFLSIALRPCFFDCFDAIDFNAIVDAIEVQPAGTELSICPRDLVLTESGDGSVVGVWSPGENVDVSGYTVYRNGVEILTLAGNATEFQDDDPPCERRVVYEVVPESDAPDYLCPDLRMLGGITRAGCAFDVPLRVNMGGNDTVDSRGRVWFGDRPCVDAAGIDALLIRPDLSGGTNAICNWCVPDAASLEKLGFDPSHPGDRHILSTIRWDDGTNQVEDFRVEFEVPEGEYDINLYFNECCCTGRHFRIEIQGEIVHDDTSYLDYDAEPALGKVGVLRFDGIEVDNGFLVIGFLPCGTCAGASDFNAIVNAIEVLPSGAIEICDNGTDDDGDGAIDCDDSSCAAAPGCGVGARFVRGDADASGGINLTDGVSILLWSFQGGVEPACLDAADTDDTGAINLSDPIRIFQWLFLGGVAPVDPMPSGAAYVGADCGLDPTDDDLFGCAVIAQPCL